MLNGRIIAAVIIGSVRRERSNAKHIGVLDEASRIEPGFPTDFLQRPFVRDFLHGGLFDRVER